MPVGINQVNATWHRPPGESGSVPKTAVLTRAEERYLLLITQLREDYAASNGGRDRGWQGWVAGKLKVGQPFISRITSGERSIGVAPLELAIRRFGIAPAFFFGSFPKPPSYRDFVGVRKIPTKMGYGAFHDFIAQAPSLGLAITEAESLALSRQEWETEPTVAAYMHLLSALRACTPREDTRARRRDAVS